MSILLLKEDRAKGRQSLILDEMVKQGYITKKQAASAKKEPLTFASLDTKKVAEVAPYFQDAVQASLLRDVGLDEQALQKVACVFIQR